LYKFKGCLKGTFSCAEKYFQKAKALLKSYRSALVDSSFEIR
jgi:hypothetical protein